MANKVTLFTTTPKSRNNAPFESHLLAKIQESELNSWWVVHRTSTQFNDHQFNLLVFRDLADVLHISYPARHKHKLLIPLYQYLDYIQINSEHSEKLLEVFFHDSYIPLDVHHQPIVSLGFIKQYRHKQNFITNEFSWYGFYQNEIVPIYLVNKQGELENQESGHLPHCDLYIEFEHIKFAELVFRAYSLLVECG
ncbi:MAG: hypothetical protein K2Y14_06800, partial [Burkholderiales bacterium]|nr:hypothetical protein [Burkholderiales bacterium]